jgi:hypothetical protein
MWYALGNKESFQQKATVDVSDGVTEYTFGGDATDVLAIVSLGIKYNSTDTFFTRAKPLSYPDTVIVGNESFAEGAPVYYRITKKVSGVPTAGIQIDPEPESDVTSGLQITYLERPAHMSEETDTPYRVPKELHKWIVTGASVNCFIKLDQDSRAERMQNRFDKKMAEFMITNQETTSDGVKRIKPTRRSINKFYFRTN